jgi:hypothetical protein
MSPLCAGCRKKPSELAEYIDDAAAAGMTPDEYCRENDGTYNPSTNHYSCTDCYIKAGMPTSPKGWIAP